MCRCCRWMTGREDALLLGSDNVSGSVAFGGVGRVGRSHFSERHAVFRGTRRVERPTAVAEVPSFPASNHQGAVRRGRINAARWRPLAATLQEHKKKSKIKNLAGFLLQISMSAGAAEAETSNKS